MSKLIPHSHQAQAASGGFCFKISQSELKLYTKIMNVNLSLDWKKSLSVEMKKTYFTLLSSKVEQLYATETVYPPLTDIFIALNLCSLHNVKVVILGQDPYHGEGQAQGLAFSVPAGIPVPPSLRNILKELESDLDKKSTATRDLTLWAKQGVLLLNSTLTVEKDRAGSHQKLGWEEFTDTIISMISQNQNNVVFLLWGAFAIKKRSLINETKHLVLVAPHPSPLSAYRGFFGCKHFSMTNTYLKKHQKKPIAW